MGRARTAKRLTQRFSPLEQVQRRHRVAVVDSARPLSPQDEATLKQVLYGKYEHVHNDDFRKPSTERKLFVDVPPIDRPDVSWYHPVLDTAGEGSSKGGRAVLLTAAQERQLFLQFNYCRYRVIKLREKIGDGPIEPETGRELLRWYRRAEALREQIAQTNLALVLAMAKRTRMTEVDFAELVSEGNMALLRAVDKFDVARGFKFSTYACRAILKAFSRIGVSMSRYRHLFPTEFDPKLERSDYSTRKRAEHEEDCVDEVADIIRHNRADLSDIERSVISYRFGVGPHREAYERRKKPLTLEQVGKIIGVTKERVRQIQNKALDKVRQQLEDDYLS